MFEHRMKFRNRSNQPVNIAIANAGVVEGHKNGLEAGATWEWNQGWPIGYDISVYHDVPETRIDPAKQNIAAIFGYVLIGAGAVAAILAGLVEVFSLGMATPLAGAMMGGSFAAITGGLAGVGVFVAGAGITLEIVKASLSPATKTGLFGTDNYDIDISGGLQAIGFTATGNQIQNLKMDLDDVALRWHNTTGGTSGTVGSFKWVWNRNPVPGATKDLTCLPDGRILGIGMDDNLWVREDLASDWKRVPNTGKVRQKTVEGETDSFETMKNVTAMPDGSIYTVFAMRVGGKAKQRVFKMDKLEPASGWKYVDGSDNANCVVNLKGEVALLFGPLLSTLDSGSKQWIPTETVPANIEYVASMDPVTGALLGITHDGKVHYSLNGVSKTWKALDDDRKMTGTAFLEPGVVIGNGADTCLYAAVGLPVVVAGMP
jgi:hypothetical protein